MHHRSVRSFLALAAIVLCSAGLTGCADNSSAQAAIDDIKKEHEEMFQIMKDMKSASDVDSSLTRLEGMKNRLIALGTKLKDMKVTKSFMADMEKDLATYSKEYEQRLMPEMMRIMGDPELRKAFTEKVMPKLEEFQAALQAVFR